MRMRGTKYIVRRGDIYQLRLPIPKDIQGKLNRKELRRSLKTGDAPTAKRRAFRATLLFMELCDSVRLMQDISDAQANDIVSAFFKLLVHAYTPPASWKKEPIDQQLQEQIVAADEYVISFANRIETQTQTPAEVLEARTLLENFGLNFDQLPTERQKQIWTGMRRAYLENVRFLEHQLNGGEEQYSASDELFKHIDHLHAEPKQVQLGTPPAHTSTSLGLSLGDAIERYIKRGKEDGISSNGPWGHTSLETNRKVLKWFGDFAGNTSPLLSIDKACCRDFKDKYRQVERGSGVERSFDDVMSNDPTRRLAPKTAANQFDRLKTFFNWLEKEGYVDTNPTTNLSIPVPKQAPDQKRRPFTIPELNTFFSSPIYTGYASANHRYKPGSIKPLRDHDYWMPLLLLYTGMRLGEIMNIPLSNVHLMEDEAHFDLLSTDQNLKNSQSVRKVPIHSDLLSFGFAEWVLGRRKFRPKNDPLMSGFKTQMPLEQYYSKRLNNYIKRLVTKDKRLVGHSLRHTAKDRARSSLMNKSIMDQIFGHESSKSVGDEYGVGADLKILCRQMDKVDFGLHSEVMESLMGTEASKLL